MKNKFRIIEILLLLYDNTDAEHYETTKTILSYLEKNNIAVDRKTLQDDMEKLVDMNIGIKKVKSSPNKYYWEERIFNIKEIQMLIDMVLTSNLTNKKNKKALVKKIMKLTSKYDKNRLKNQVNYFITGVEPDNLEAYKNVGVITDAIKSKSRISFKYFEYDENKAKVYRNNGKYYHVSPYNLFYNDSHYYLIGYDEKHQSVISYRVDRMEKCRGLEDKYVDPPENFNIMDYTYKYFKMYDGEEVVVELEVQNYLMKYIIDKFGMDVETEINTEETFIARPIVKLSPVFYGWVFQFAGKIKIIGPEQAIEEYKEMREV